MLFSISLINRSASWLDFILQSDHIPQTISTSYGDDEQTVPFTYVSRVCKLFAELGIQGVLVLFASGDGSVGDGNVDTATQQCCTNNKKHTRSISHALHAHTMMVVSVMAMGGTMSIPEVAASFSGGGFSDYFPRPAYQDKSVNTYLGKLHHGTYNGLFNCFGWGILDVSAQARKFQIVWQGQCISIVGTSAATPMFVGLVYYISHEVAGVIARKEGHRGCDIGWLARATHLLAASDPTHYDRASVYIGAKAK
ncbi:peptidase S8/S53 domain-containing protein [Mycena olivaceomarginata]|nr:peptidase S8/S53 domain-containing protein [Mycena olivaceomarginata]